MKNNQPLRDRNRTSRPNRPGTGDRRVQKTRASLHDALIGLAREKPYRSIAVKEILDRANVGRSTFYTHFGDKDELLESGILEMLQSVRDRSRSGSATERIVGFSRPVLDHIERHRRASGPHMARESRLVMHAHLEEVLASLVADDLATVIGASRPTSQRSESIPAELIARHVASTFVMVLNWWVENDSTLTPADVDTRFRRLVVPTLVGLVGELA